MKTENEKIQWIGTFTSRDRAEIDALRAAQATLVERGDAEAYAQLCTEDVHSMLPGHDVVAGRPHFIEFQATLFRGARFEGMRKFPLRVERSGDLAVEVGRQEIAAKTGSFTTRQKYTHVMRNTPDGWRYVVLMSSASM
jgi:ketosteroid isomerase-like protein